LILEIAAKTDLEVINNAHINEEQISQFDEILLSNAVKGIQWIGAYKAKRYDNKISKQIHKILISSIFGNIEK